MGMMKSSVIGNLASSKTQMDISHQDNIKLTQSTKSQFKTSMSFFPNKTMLKSANYVKSILTTTSNNFKK